MVIKSQENSFGAWAFLIGVILAIIIGLSTSLIPIPALRVYSAQIYAILVLLGLIVGFTIQVSGKDSQAFLLAGAILVVISKFGMESVTGSLIILVVLNTVFNASIIFAGTNKTNNAPKTEETVFNLAKI